MRKGRWCVITLGVCLLLVSNAQAEIHSVLVRTPAPQAVSVMANAPVGNSAEKTETIRPDSPITDVQFDDVIAPLEIASLGNALPEAEGNGESPEPSAASGAPESALPMELEDASAVPETSEEAPAEVLPELTLEPAPTEGVPAGQPESVPTEQPEEAPAEQPESAPAEPAQAAPMVVLPAETDAETTLPVEEEPAVVSEKAVSEEAQIPVTETIAPETADTPVAAEPQPTAAQPEMAETQAAETTVAEPQADETQAAEPTVAATPAAEPTAAAPQSAPASSATVLPNTPANLPESTAMVAPMAQPAESRLRIAGWLETGTWGNQYGDDSTVENGEILGENIRNYGWHVNQLWVFAERKADNHGYGMDWGFRADAMFGTEAEQSHGDCGFDGRWGTSGDGYGWAIPHLYAELAMNRWTFKMGKFCSPLLYEPSEAEEKLFYSHSYAHYHEPCTFTGVLGNLHWNDKVSFFLGADTGMNSSFENRYGDFGFILGTHVQLSQRLRVKYGFMWDNIHPGSDRHGYPMAEDWHFAHHYGQLYKEREVLNTVVLEYDLTSRLNYAFQIDYGRASIQKTNAWTHGYDQIAIVNYLTYKMTERLTLGARFEWFRMNDLESTSLGTPSRQNRYELAGVAKFHVCHNLAITGEIRYDKVFGYGTYSVDNYEMFGKDGRCNDQLSFGTSLLLTF